MKLKDQFVCLELAKKMKEMGFEQKSLWYWEESTRGIKNNDKIFTLALYRERCLKAKWIKYFSAYTVAELGERIKQSGLELPIYCYLRKAYIFKIPKNVKKESGCVIGIKEENSVESTEANARAKMLIYLKEIGLI